MNYTTFDFSRFTDLKYLEIGSNSFRSVETFIIDGINNLTTLKIGERSFTYSNIYVDLENENKSFHIKNCESLEVIEIGMRSFSDYAGEFELVNLPSLQMLIIGNYSSLDYDSFNFYYSSFVIRGIN